MLLAGLEGMVVLFLFPGLGAQVTVTSRAGQLCAPSRSHGELLGCAHHRGTGGFSRTLRALSSLREVSLHEVSLTDVGPALVLIPTAPSEVPRDPDGGFAKTFLSCLQ